MDPIGSDSKLWFAWYPVDLSYFETPYWYRLGRRAWLRKVRVVTTMWGVHFTRN